MQHIRMQEVLRRLPAGWVQRADAALADVTAADDDRKAERVNAHADVWQDVKNALEDVSDGKCWYCESKQIRSDRNVDHFRPKNRVCECPNHRGYWWLAFVWSNYRLSCTYCNSRRRDRETKEVGGKQDHFPLTDESCRAYGPQDDLGRESPELLDPTTFADPGLLWFQADGMAVPKYSKEVYPLHYQRADISIELYHLNHVDIKEKRQELANLIVQKVREGNIFCARAAAGDQMASQAWEGVIRDLYEMVQRKSEYSSAARSLISGLSIEYPWVRSILEVN